VRRAANLKATLNRANRLAVLTLADYCMTRKDKRDDMVRFFESTLSKSVEKIDLKKVPASYDQITRLYEGKDYAAVLKAIHESVYTDGKMTTENVRILIDSILNDTVS